MKVLKTILVALKRTFEFVLRCIAIVIYMIPVVYIGAPLLLVAFLVEPSIGYTLLAILLLFFVIRHFVLLCRRISFLRELKKLCKQEGFSMRKTGRPLLSAWFFVRGGVEIVAEDKTHTLFFVACRKRRVPVTLHEDGTAVFHHAIKIGRAAWTIRHANGHGYGKWAPIMANLIAWDHYWRFAEDIPKNSCVLLAPAPNKVSGIAGGMQISVDNGVTVGNYTVYTCGAFLRNFLRETDE